MSHIIKVDPLHIHVYNIVKNMILEGEYQPGERLVELKLAEKLGVSRGPIREAIRMLVQDGLLVQYEGPIQVYQPTLQDMREIFQCRESLESLAIRLAAIAMTDEKLQQLKLNIDQTKEALDHRKTTEVGWLDRQFHDHIIQFSENKQLIQLMDVIHSKIIYIRNCLIRDYYDDVIDFIDEHERIYAALLQKDEKKAEAEMSFHVHRSLERILHFYG